jgi:hypothetical protein
MFCWSIFQDVTPSAVFVLGKNFFKGNQRENKKQKMVGGNFTVPNTQKHTQPKIWGGGAPPPPPQRKV